MPIGVILNALSVVDGGITGAFAGNKLSVRFKEDINMIFGACSMGMGIKSGITHNSSEMFKTKHF